MIVDDKLTNAKLLCIHKTFLTGLYDIIFKLKITKADMNQLSY